MKLDVKRNKEFAERARKLGFMQTELAILLKKSPRCVSFYMTGSRNIPTPVWAKLIELEKRERDDLCRIITKVKK